MGRLGLLPNNSARLPVPHHRVTFSMFDMRKKFEMLRVNTLGVLTLVMNLHSIGDNSSVESLEHYSVDGGANSPHCYSCVPFLASLCPVETSVVVGLCGGKDFLQDCFWAFGLKHFFSLVFVVERAESAIDGLFFAALRATCWEGHGLG